MKENKSIKLGTAWVTQKLHSDTTQQLEAGSYELKGKVRFSIVLRTTGRKGSVENYLAIYLTHSGEHTNLIPLGNLLDESESFGECPPNELPENMFIREKTTIDRQVFSALKAMVRNWILKDANLLR